MPSELLTNLGIGLSTALTFDNLLYCLIGVTVGMAAGVIPGFSSLVTMSLLLPLTYHVDPTAGVIMMGGIFYGTVYGGSTASILLNLPGTPSSAVVCLDGHPMAQQGRAGVALFMTAVASFFGATVGILLMTLFSQGFAELALYFGPAEYFSLVLLGLIAAATLSEGSPIKGIAMVTLGVLLGLVGIDTTSGVQRFTFGQLELLDGASLIALAMGIFGVAQIIEAARSPTPGGIPETFKLRSMLPNRDDVRRSWWPMARGSGIGSFVGLLPGVGATVASFMAYALEKKVARDPTRFGRGAIEGVVAPESANNAADQTAFIPTLTLGVPGSASMALILTVLILHGITPGPLLLVDEPELFWGLIMSFWIGNIILLIFNIPFIGLWVRILLVPPHILYPSIVAFICIGAYSVNYSTFDVMMVVVFGALGYGLRLMAFPAAPLLLGFVLGPMMEENFRRALVLSEGDFGVFVQRPVSLIFLAATASILLWGSINRSPHLKIFPWGRR
jgi:TctA family transporter